jgi:hypothetical protein
MRAHDVIGRTRASPGAARADANLAQIWGRDASGQTRRTVCVAPLERTKPARQSDRTRSDACGRRPAGDALTTDGNANADCNVWVVRVCDRETMACRLLFPHRSIASSRFWLPGLPLSRKEERRRSQVSRSSAAVLHASLPSAPHQSLGGRRLSCDGCHMVPARVRIFYYSCLFRAWIDQHIYVGLCVPCHDESMRAWHGMADRDKAQVNSTVPCRLDR